MYERARQLEAIVGTPSPQKWLAFKSKTLDIGLLSCQWPYHADTPVLVQSPKLSSIEPYLYT